MLLDVVFLVLPRFLKQHIAAFDLHDCDWFKILPYDGYVIHGAHVGRDGVYVYFSSEALGHYLYDFRSRLQAVIDDEILVFYVLVVFELQVSVEVGVQSYDGYEGEVEDGVTVEELRDPAVETV